MESGSWVFVAARENLRRNAWSDAHHLKVREKGGIA
jgi:hypothetical protein